MSRITQWLAGAADPVRLAEQLRFEPDAWQRKILRSNAKYVCLVCSRQVGKSTVTALAALHRALYFPGSVVLIFSPSERQSNELFLKVSGFYRALGKPIDAPQETVHVLRLENDSRIISLPASESNVRGYTASMILVDEAGFVDDALFDAVSPMLAVSGGRMIMMGTPAGRRGRFYEASISKSWETYTVPAPDCPRISVEFLDAERERLGDVAFEQEYLCSFADASGAAFRGDDIDAFLAGAAPPPVSRPDRAVPESPEQARAMKALQRHLRNRAGQQDRLRRVRQVSCQHRWRNGPPFDCMFGCGAHRREA